MIVDLGWKLNCQSMLMELISHKNLDNRIINFYLCLLENQNFAESIGINATPSFLIFNDEILVRVIGAQPIEKFVDAIKQIN